jgi:hypothetical protein
MRWTMGGIVRRMMTRMTETSTWKSESVLVG